MRSPKICLFGAASLWALSAAALAQGLVNIPAKSLSAALDDYIHQSGVQLIYNADDVKGLSSNAVHDTNAQAALGQLLAGITDIESDLRDLFTNNYMSVFL